MITFLLAGSSMVLLGWWTEVDSLVQIRPSWPAVPANTAAGFLLFGIAFAAVEWGRRRAALLALLPSLLGLLTQLQTLLGFNLGLDEILVRDGLQIQTEFPGRVHALVSICFILGGLAVSLLASKRFERFRSLGLAFAGSVILSIAFSTLVGYILGLPAIYRWGTETSLPPECALLLLVLGGLILTLAWREYRQEQQNIPTWVAMPVVVASATLTIILWVALRERESAYLGTNTQIAINGLASAINLELERQSRAVDRLARRWSQLSATEVAGWELDAKVLLDDAPGAFALTRVGKDLHTSWIYPERGNEALLSLDHSTDPVREDALKAIRERNSTVVSGSLVRRGQGDAFAIYAPLYDASQLTGSVDCEFAYRGFCEAIERRLRLTRDYRVAISIGNQRVFETVPAAEQAAIQPLESVFNIFERRWRIEMSPSPQNLRRNQHYLPELALAACFGITLLLGLSMHLARAAWTGLRRTELSNEQLVAENEERRRVEEMLKVSDERLRLALDSTQIGIFEWHIPGNQFYFSPGLWTMLGYEPGSVGTTSETWTNLIHPDDVAAYRASFQRQLAGSAPFVDPEYRVRTANGNWLWLYARSKAVSRSSHLPPARIIGTLQDITARKGAEEALRLSQAATRKLSLVAAKTDNIVIIASPSGMIEWVNESFERILEYGLGEVAGRNPAAFMIGPETSPKTVRRIRTSLARGEAISTEIINYSKSGRRYDVQLEIQPVRNEAGVLENFIAMATDISVRVETERNLRRAKVEADAASRAKSEFLASMSHEIRTPMNGVIGMTSLLLETPLNHEQRDFVNTIRTSGEALLTIINDILDFSKIESGKMELENLPFDLSICIEDALDLFSLPAGNKKIELVYHVDESVPSWIEGDVTRVRQVLVNLVNNAVKFTPTGSISVRVKRLSQSRSPFDDPRTVTLEFAVADTGIGIPPERRNRLFQPFSQVDSSTTRKYGGTGLGLAICHRLCKLMGGNIGVISKVGEGSTFAFTLRAEAVETPAGWGLPELPVRLNYGEILCIDDNAVSQLRLQTFFRDWGARPVAASSMETAAEYLATHPAPIAIVLDYDLTATAQGYQFRERISQTNLPTLLLLQPGPAAYQLQAFAGRRGVATAPKPLRTLSLIRGVQTLFDDAPESLPPFSISGEARLLAHELPLDVLLVEDNPVNQKVALRFLERLGYRADAVENGLEALNTLQARNYHLIFMDLQMPEMDGCEATRQIRRRMPADRQPKIIALTANALHGDRELCLTAGMDDYITKPVKLHEIADAIRRQFSPGSRTPLRVS